MAEVVQSDMFMTSVNLLEFARFVMKPHRSLMFAFLFRMMLFLKKDFIIGTMGRRPYQHLPERSWRSSWLASFTSCKYFVLRVKMRELKERKQGRARENRMKKKNGWLVDVLFGERKSITNKWWPLQDLNNNAMFHIFNLGCEWSRKSTCQWKRQGWLLNHVNRLN